MSTIRSVKTEPQKLRVHPQEGLRGAFFEILIYRILHGEIGLGGPGCGLLGVYHQLLDLVIDRVTIRHEPEARDRESWKRQSGCERPCPGRSSASTYTPPNLLSLRVRVGPTGMRRECGRGLALSVD